MANIKYQPRYCSYCRKEISEEDFTKYDMSCKACYETKLARVKDLAQKNIGVMEGPDGKKIPEQKLVQKMGEEQKRLEWVKQKEKKTK